MTKAELIEVLAAFPDDTEILATIEGSPQPGWRTATLIHQRGGKTNTVHTGRAGRDFDDVAHALAVALVAP